MNAKQRQLLVLLLKQMLSNLDGVQAVGRGHIEAKVSSRRKA